MLSRRFLALAPLLVALACTETSPDSFGPPQPADDCADFSTPQGFVDAVKCDSYRSCAFQCSCTEPEKPYACPGMRPWDAVAHAGACGAFDGTTYPTVVPGKCTATAPDLDAKKYAGADPDVPGRYHLGDGHFVQPAGHEQVVRGDGIRSAFLVDALLVPGTSYAVLVDAGVKDNAVYSIDLDALAADQPALVTSVAFPRPEQVDYGMAFEAPDHVIVSGAGNGKLFFFTIDTQTGKLTRDEASDVDLGASVSGRSTGWYSGGLAVTADPNKLLVAAATDDTTARVVDLAQKKWTTIDVGPAQEFFGLFADPNDPNQNTYYLTTYDTRELLRLDLASGKVSARMSTGKNPEGVAFLGTTHIAVANSDDDTIGVYDAVSGDVVQTLSVRPDPSYTGAQPGVLAYDASRQRLYATLSGINAIGVYAFDQSQGAPLTPLGEIPTGWWPTVLRLRPDGSLFVANAKGRSTGPTSTDETPEAMKGSVQLIPAPSDSELADMTKVVIASRSKTPAEGYPTVTCPQGAQYDFPVPLTNDAGPSTKIQHVVYVIRENKTFDDLFGDLPDLNGEPKDVMSPGKMDEYWQNARALAQTFTNFDNYYIAAEQSLQGHVWTAYGRSTDWIERTWSTTWGRAVRLPRAGIEPKFGSPAEGSLFVWADRNQIPYQDMGEIVGTGAQGFDTNYPGIVYSQTVPDTEKACYLAARARATCDLSALSYVVLPNDHTVGDTPGSPTPELMIAVNDVATGMIVDAISHSPMWPTTLIVITEDDPQDGYDHVDGHRTPFFLASPWVKRGYVSHTDIGAGSIHKLFAHLFGKPYQSESVASAAIPYDAFTSTPDYTPYNFKPLVTPVSCNPSADKMGGSGGTTQHWDFTLPDNQPGLPQQVLDHMRHLGSRAR